MKSKMFEGVGITPDFSTKAMHLEMQRQREAGEDVTLKSFLQENWDSDLTPEAFYRQLGVDMTKMTVEKMFNTSDLTRFLFPEIFRDAIRRGLEYTPFFRDLITGDEALDGNAVTMPQMRFDEIDPDEYRLRDVNEGATIPEAEVLTWEAKQVTVRKKARGLKQTYESIMWTPIDLAAIYFEELGARLGADLDRDLIDIAINGDQTNGSEAAPVMGSTDGINLTYRDLARTWIRYRRIGRNSTAIIANEADALTLLMMEEFQRTREAGGVNNATGTNLNVRTPMPADQDVYVHDAVPAGQLILVDKARAFVKLTAMPLMVETERIVSRQITGEYVSIITGFANVFKDGRLILDYNTSLATNPGPTVQY